MICELRILTALLQAPQLLLSSVRSTQDPPQNFVPPVQGFAAVTVAVTVGVGAVEVVVVMPRQEQALLSAEVPVQKVALTGSELGTTVI